MTFMAYTVSAIMALGAMFGAANTMYSAVSARSTEIATLRAIGFGPSAVVASLLIEALLLAVIGAALGALVVGLLFNGSTIGAHLGFESRRVLTKLHVDLSLIALGMGWACGIGLFGAILPAVRAARLPVVEAMRDA